LRIVRGLVNALLGSIGVEVIRVPCYVEAIVAGRVGRAIFLDRFLELLMAYVALRFVLVQKYISIVAEGVFTQGHTVSDTISILKFVILRRVDLNARLVRKQGATTKRGRNS
jgi:hypothetical protein